MKQLWRSTFMAMAILIILPVWAEETWIVGKWELYFDPDNVEKDWLEFAANGDAKSIGPLGELDGFYVVAGKDVKAVFTYKGKDIIATFHVNEQRDELRIVTSHTGQESIYRKMSHQ